MLIKSILENHGFRIDIELSLRIWKILEVYNISSAEEVARHKHQLIALVAKTGEEQKVLNDAFHVFGDTPKIRALEAKIEIPLKTFNWIKKRKRLFSFRNILIIAAGVIVLSAAFLVLRDWGSDPTIHQYDYPSPSGDKAGSKRSIEPVCDVLPDFSYTFSPKNNFNVLFTGFTDSSDCVKSYYFDFGDGSQENIIPSLGDSLMHRYPQPGNYEAKLTIRDYEGNEYYASKQIVVTNDLIGSLPVISLITAPASFRKTIFFWSLLALLAATVVALLALALMFIEKLLRKKKEHEIGRAYQLDKLVHGKIDFEYPDRRSDVLIKNINAGNSLKSSFEPDEMRRKIDAKKTIYHSVRRAGFPSLYYAAQVVVSPTIILVDLGSGTNQQAELFVLLIARLETVGFNSKVYYYREYPFYVSPDKSMDRLVSLQSIANEYSGSNLLHFGTGYGFLEKVISGHGHMSSLNPSTGESKNILSALVKWRMKILMTPVPRTFWAGPERELLQFFKLLPATETALEIAIHLLNQTRNYKVPSSSGEEISYTGFPVPNSIQKYEEFFKPDGRLLLWLYSLAIPDKPDFNITVAVGKQLEKSVFKGEENSLVTYENLLRLSSVEWMQNGILPSGHRAEMLAELRTQPNGDEIIRNAALAVLQMSRQVQVEQGTVLAMKKKVNETVLSQWTTKKSIASIAVLKKYHLLDNFNLKQFSGHLKFLSSSAFVNYRKWSIPLGLLLAGGVLIGIDQMPATSSFFHENIPFTMVQDSFYLYNNMARDTMLREWQIGITFPSTTRYDSMSRKLDPNGPAMFPVTRQLLLKASTFNDTSRILLQNQKILTYNVARNILESRNYRQALDSFRSVVERHNEFIPFYKDSVQILAQIGKAQSYYFMGYSEHLPLTMDYLKALASSEDSAYRINYESLNKILHKRN